jgi:hypothetical protein
MEIYVQTDRGDQKPCCGIETSLQCSISWSFLLHIFPIGIVEHLHRNVGSQAVHRLWLTVLCMFKTNQYELHTGTSLSGCRGRDMKVAPSEETCFSSLTSWRFFKSVIFWIHRNHRGHNTVHFTVTHARALKSTTNEPADATVCPPSVRTSSVLTALVLCCG